MPTRHPHTGRYHPPPPEPLNVEATMQCFDLNGQRYGTGLRRPKSLATAFPLYDDAPGLMLTLARIKEIAQTNPKAGRALFTRDYIGNQRDKGSCNGWAGAKALQRARVRRGLSRVNLSGAYLYSLINGGRDGGSMLDDGMQAITTRGVATEETVGWDRIYPYLYDKAKADAEADKNKAFECYAVRSMEALFSAAALDFDIVVAVHADNGFMRLNGEGIAGGGYGPGNHAVAADGLYWSDRANAPVLDAYNSWGFDYGDDGRMGLTWAQHFTHTNPYHVFYAIRSTEDGGDSPPPAR